MKKPKPYDDLTLIRASANRSTLLEFFKNSNRIDASTVRRMYMLEVRSKDRPRILEQLMARYKKECEAQLKTETSK